MRETSTLRERDLLKAANLLTEIYGGIRERKRELSHEQDRDDLKSQEWADEDRSPRQEQRDQHDDRIAEQRSRGTRQRSKPRDRSAR